MSLLWAQGSLRAQLPQEPDSTASPHYIDPPAVDDLVSPSVKSMRKPCSSLMILVTCDLFFGSFNKVKIMSANSAEGEMGVWNQR